MIREQVKIVTLRIATIFLILASTASCHTIDVRAAQPPPPIVQPGSPGMSSRVIGADRAVDLSRVQYTKADVQFMQGMIGHHAQALDMTTLLSTRTSREDMRKLALRIELSQADEIKMMQRWLQVRGQEVPDEHAHHIAGAALMPGMLAPEEMDRLAAANGTTFDQLFLEFMIKHHAGALIMVDELFSNAGAGQDSEIFAFASDVDADQRAEIDRMSIMLKELQK
ncbi:MAG TPA: DUF305 domain-containing protein [Terriglobia bacterium]|nr:DUF305 domain-containing protein [Terriglobia bacterium]